MGTGQVEYLTHGAWAGWALRKRQWQIRPFIGSSEQGVGVRGRGSLPCSLCEQEDRAPHLWLMGRKGLLITGTKPGRARSACKGSAHSGGPS